MRGDEAQEHCPDINLVRVPNVREKADLTKYREAGKSVAEVLQTFTPLLERASVDEAYLDITEQVKARLKEMNEGKYKILPHSLENTFVVGYETIGLFIHEISANQSDTENTLPEFNEEENNIDSAYCQKYNLNLLIGATIASEIRSKVKEKTGYECSAGIAHNKILAKLACGINKPNKQTILSLNETPKLLKNLPVQKIKGLGGKFGEEIIAELQIKTVGDLLRFSKTELQKRYDDKNGNWLFLIARGVDLEAVTPRFYSKSIGCCKKFPGRNAITGLNTLNHWLGELAKEITDRLDKDIIENNRKAKQMVVSFVQEISSNDVSSSRSGNLNSYDAELIAKSALEIIQKNTDQFFKQDNSKSLNNPIKFLGISVGKFENVTTNQTTLQEMFAKQKPKATIVASVEVTENFNIPLNNDMKNKTHNVTKDSVFNCESQINSVNTIKKINLEKQPNLKFDENLEENDLLEKKASGNVSPVITVQKNRENVELNDSIESAEVNQLDADKSISKFAPHASNSKNGYQTSDSQIFIHTSNSRNLEYTKTYAEYMSPPGMEIDYVKCSECGTKVLSFNYQVHLDSHLAFKLSQQLREEYRNELKSQMPNNVPSKNKKHELNSSLTKKNVKKKKQDVLPMGNITKYLKPCEKPITNENFIKCSECGFFVDETKIFEHKDLHLAQKINQEWNYS
ncbi:DNA polymerase eta isoform X2 [Condylostylus longicornis]|nr:DNA polymerase eta isoform X2 [Condylostylus longicornis]